MKLAIQNPKLVRKRKYVRCVLTMEVRKGSLGNFEEAVEMLQRTVQYHTPSGMNVSLVISEEER